MMVETILESPTDLGMSNGGLPQWKRELLQRRAARSQPPRSPHAQAATPPSSDPPIEEDEELRYGPGIVKRLKSRYLSLALRDAPRRRPSVLRRAASLEHLVDERPPPAPRPPRLPRPASVVLAPVPTRRDAVKRARSVDALSRLETHEETPPPLPASPPPPPPCPPPAPRATRPPRRPTPLLRETERPPPDVVRSTLRKFESAPPRRAAPAARVSAVLRGLGARTPPLAHAPLCSTPEPQARSPSPALADLSIIEVECSPPEATRPVSRAALEGIARAGSTQRFVFSGTQGSHLPPLGATNPVMLSRARHSLSPRRVGVIKPMPALPLDRSMSSPTTPHRDDTEDVVDKVVPRSPSPSPKIDDIPPSPISVPSSPAPVFSVTYEKDSPPAAAVEPRMRSPPAVESPVIYEKKQLADILERFERRSLTPEPDPKPADFVKTTIPVSQPVEPVLNGHKEYTYNFIEKCNKSEKSPTPEPTKIVNGKASRISAAKIERGWNNTNGTNGVSENGTQTLGVRLRGAGKGSAGAAGGTSVVFNFSSRKEVPDYIENDGLILRASRRDKLKAGDQGVVLLRPAVPGDASDEEDGSSEQRPPSPCSVRFINDNVLINGRSSLIARTNKDRLQKLKLQFDDSLTRTFEYPSETSMTEDDEPSLRNLSHLPANTALGGSALCSYQPCKTTADTFQLGLTRPPVEPPPVPSIHNNHEDMAVTEEARPCSGDVARSFSHARDIRTDLLF